MCGKPTETVTSSAMSCSQSLPRHQPRKSLETQCYFVLQCRASRRHPKSLTPTEIHIQSCIAAAPQEDEPFRSPLQCSTQDSYGGFDGRTPRVAGSLRPDWRKGEVWTNRGELEIVWMVYIERAFIKVYVKETHVQEVEEKMGRGIRRLTFGWGEQR